MEERTEALSLEQKRARLKALLRKQAQEPQVCDLSFGQERLWFLDQLQPDSPVYNMPDVVRIRGPLNTRALEQSLEEVIRRHEALRTTIQEIGRRPVQVIDPPKRFTLPLVDLTGLPPDLREEEAFRQAAQESSRPFQLSRGPLLRATLLKLRDDDHILVTVMHHIISDGWSMGVFGREVSALYRAFAAGRPSPLPELPVQYADFAQWQRNWLQGEVLEAELAYWKEQLSGAPLLQLPTDHPRPAVQSNRGASQGFALSPVLTDRLKALSRREGATLFMTLLAAFQTLLYRYTGQEEVSVGTPVANRNRVETEGLIGFFVNTLVVRTSLVGNPTFRELLGRVREVALGAYMHQDLPFEKLVEALQPERRLSHHPLFQVMFALQNAPGAPAELPGLTLTPVPVESATAKFDLDLNLAESEQGLVGEITYATDLFEGATIARMVGHWQSLLEAIAADPEQRVADLPLMTRAERQQLLVGWNQTATEYPRERSVAQLVEAQAAQRPDALAVACGGRSLSYGELNRQANRLAHFLRRQGIGPDRPVGLCLERSPELLVAMLAVLKAGGAYLPIDPAYPAERIGYILADAGVPVLLTQERLCSRLPPGDARVFPVDAAGPWAGESEANPAGGATAEQLAYLIYTSGSTGRPKGVEVGHGALLNLVWWFRRAYELTPADRVSYASGIGFDASVSEIWPALSAGASLHLPDEESRVNPVKLREWLLAERLTVAFAPTPLAEALLGLSWPEETPLRVLYTGGDKLRHYPPPGLPFRVVDNYGPTECACIATSMVVPPLREAERVPPIGRPIDNVQLYILDAHRQPVPVGVPGELYIGGESVGRGYRNRPELTAERFVANPLGPGRLYRTGDLARYLPDGNIEFLGRNDQQVKIRGLRIELGEIEAVLAQHPGVREGVVLAHEEPTGEKRLVAYLVPGGESAPESGELRQFLRAQLPEYMVPAVFVALAALPLTPSGKVDRRALPAPETGRESIDTPFVAPRTQTEEVLARIWAEVLGLDQVGVHDHFFALGGHSLLATQVVARAGAALGLELPVRALFEAPTVAELAQQVEAALREQGGLNKGPIRRVGRGGPLPLSFAQQRLWFLDQFDPAAAVYNIPTAVRLTGKLNRVAMESALREIVRRHETLRTTFHRVDGQPVQVIAPEVGLTLPTVDLSELPAEEREERARSMAAAEARRPFCLETGPLLRVNLLQLGPEEHLLLLTLHHIAADGWSMGVFGREVSALYQAFAGGQPSPLPELPVQYADFAQWQRNWLQGEVLEAELAYWKEQLSGAPLLQLPTDHPRPAVQSNRGASQGFALSPVLTDRLKALSRREGTTLFMTLLAAFQTLLYRYTGQEEVSVGTPVANRNRVETEGLIGFFVNTLVMRTSLAGNPTFRELLGRVREVALGAYMHQDLPFEKLVEALQPERRLSHHPLFQVMFALQNAPGAPAELPGLTLTPVPVESATAKFDLDLNMAESEQGLVGEITYATDLFEGATIARMIGHWQSLLEAIAADPEQRVADLPLLTAAERQQLLVAWNQTATGYPRERSVAQLVEAQAAQRPDALAVACGGRSLSYGEMNRRANRLAHFLRRQGIGPDRPVGLCLERSPELLVAMLAVLKAGGAYLPIDPAYPAERIGYILADAGVPVLLTQERLCSRLPPGDARVFPVDTAGPWDGESEANPAGGTTAEQLAYLIYTSGSTGRPKGVEVGHGALLNLVWWFRRAYELTPADRVSYASGIGFDASVSEIWPALSAGASLHLPDEESRVNPVKLREWLLAERLTVAFAPTPLAEALLGLSWPEETPLRVLYTGGDKLRHYPPPGLPFRVADNYGPTECACIATSMVVPPLREAERVPPIGRPIDNVQLYILDAHRQPVPVGVPGELYIGGESVGRGYRNRPELTAERFVANPLGPGRLYRTGDLARYLPDGNIEFLGRNDQQVKIRGLRIELGEIEAVLAQHPGVREGVVLAHEEPTGEKRLVAYLVPRGEPAPESGELRQFLRAQLPEYMVPAVFVALAALPLTPSGKVDRRALPAPETGREWIDTPFVAPRTQTEEVLAAIWAEVLGLDQVGVHDHFFALGGHSLLATQVVARAGAALGVELPLRTLFEAPTVAELAHVIGG